MFGKILLALIAFHVSVDGKESLTVLRKLSNHVLYHKARVGFGSGDQDWGHVGW